MPISWFQVKAEILEPAMPILTLSEVIAEQRNALFSQSSEAEALLENVMAYLKERPDAEALKAEFLTALEEWKLKQAQTL
jgi:hypothetical protein